MFSLASSPTSVPQSGPFCSRVSSSYENPDTGLCSRHFFLASSDPVSCWILLHSGGRDELLDPRATILEGGVGTPALYRDRLLRVGPESAMKSRRAANTSLGFLGGFWPQELHVGHHISSRNHGSSALTGHFKIRFPEPVVRVTSFFFFLHG